MYRQGTMSTANNESDGKISIIINKVRNPTRTKGNQIVESEEYYGMHYIQ